MSTFCPPLPSADLSCSSQAPSPYLALSQSKEQALPGTRGYTLPKSLPSLLASFFFFPLRVPGSGSPPKPPELTDFEGSRLVSCSPLSLHFRLYLLVSASLSSIVKLCFPLHCAFPNTSPEDRNMERPSPFSPQAHGKGFASPGSG